VIKAGPQQIIYTDRITGTHSNWLAESIAEIIDKPDLNQREFWRDIWSAGQSVAQVESIKPAERSYTR
jgi:nitronate monooxygenase